MMNIRRNIGVIFILIDWLHIATTCASLSSSDLNPSINGERKSDSMHWNLNHQEAWTLNRMGLKLSRDEFNSTESPLLKHQQPPVEGSNYFEPHWRLTNVLKKVLLRFNLGQCCPPWINLTQQSNEIQDEQRRLSGKNYNKQTPLKSQELLRELKFVFVNITYLSIDGQVGETTWEKYYNFYDDVQYYLRLMMLADNLLLDFESHETSSQTSFTSTISPVDLMTKQYFKFHNEIDFMRQFKRQLASIRFKIARDPIISSFLNEYLQSKTVTINVNRPNVNLEEDTFINVNVNFDLYETFISRTEFGRSYSKNISMIRECVQVFDMICSHLAVINFPSNLTRPSKQYDMIRKMSLELYRIRHELLENINLRILNQHKEIKRIFNKLNDLVAERPEIRLLGDEFDTNNIVEHDSLDILTSFSQNVKLLAHLLDHYTTNNMTQQSFYNQLSGLPEDFILLGLAISHEYETREMPQYNRYLYQLDSNDKLYQVHEQSGSNLTQQNDNSTSRVDTARQGNQPFLSKLFG